MRKAILITLLGLGGFGAKVQIPQPDPDTSARHFIIIASIGNLQEVSAGQLAVQKAKNTDVRFLGQMMVRDHGQAEQQLIQLSKRKAFHIPQEAAGGIMADLNLKNATDNFDELFIHAMLARHGNTVQVFENYAITGKDTDVKAFAQQMLPTLKAHLAAIKAINEKYKNLAAK